MIAKKRMGPVMAALGIKLVVRNIAMGANDCNPYDFCYESMGGSDADWYGWEQSYNCGHNDEYFELIARHAGWSKNKGVVYFSASGAWSPSKCPASTDHVPYSNENWNDVAAGLPRWTPSKGDLQIEKNKLNAYYTKAPSASRFIGKWSSDKSYSGVGAHGFNVWEKNPLCKTMDGGKPTSRCNGIDAAQGCALKFMTREASTYGLGHGANHHPTR